VSQPLGDPGILLREITEKSKQLREQAEAMRAELADVLVSVTSPDRAVSVTVGAGGIMRGIKVESGGLRATPTQLTDAVMRAYGEACRQAGQRSADIVERYTPNSPAVAMMRDSVPPPSPEYEGN
jgi:DNA-binding protein YbaB